MNIENMTYGNKGHLCAIINTYGVGEGPFASESTLEYFKEPYVKECLDTAWVENFNEERRRIVNEIREELAV
jgi:hypothetical protein